MDEIFIGTESYKLGTGTPTFGTRFHHVCTMLYHGTTTLSPPSKKRIAYLALAVKLKCKR